MRGVIDGVILEAGDCAYPATPDAAATATAPFLPYTCARPGVPRGLPILKSSYEKLSRGPAGQTGLRKRAVLSVLPKPASQHRNNVCIPEGVRIRPSLA